MPAIPKRLKASFNTLSQKPEAPLPGYNFQVSISGKKIGNFSEVSGLSSKIETISYRAGGMHQNVYQLPNGSAPDPVELKQGITRSTFLFEWYEMFVIDSSVAPMSVQIDLLDGDRNLQRSWVLQNAYPIGWSGPQLNAHQASVATESIRLAHNGLWRA